MDIQTHIIDHWKGCLARDHSQVLTVYDPIGRYHSLLEDVVSAGITVVDTTIPPMQAYQAALDAWRKIENEPESLVIIYRKKPRPVDDEEKILEPYYAFSQTGYLFPHGPNDDFANICKVYLPNKTAEIDALIAENNLNFDTVNNLQEGASYPTLENLTHGEGVQEIVVNFLALNSVSDTSWLGEWKRLANAHFPGMNTEGITLRDCQDNAWRYLLFSEFVLDLPLELPETLSTVPKATALQKDLIYSICQKIRNSVDMRDLYVEKANVTAKDYNLASLFSGADDLGAIVTFSFENRVEYDRLIELLRNRKIEEAKTLMAKNRQSIWFDADEDTQTFWKIAHYAVSLIGLTSKGTPEFENFDSIIEWYAKEGYTVDQNFRKFCHEINQDYDLPQLEKLTKLTVTAYQEFTERIVEIYQRLIEENGFSQVNFIRNQKAFDTYVSLELESGKKVMLVLVDGMRFEMGKELSDSCKSYESVECAAELSFIPSNTLFGMAALMPNAGEKMKLVVRNNELVPELDGQVLKTPDERFNYIKSQLPGKVIIDAPLENEGYREVEIPENLNLMVVRSLGIDGAGERFKTVGAGQMEQEMKALNKLLKWAKVNHFDTAFLMADHGYMLQRKFRQGDKVEKPIGSDIVLSERRCIAGNLNDSPETISLTPEQIGIKADVFKFAFPKGYGVYVANKTYFHEGLSLQENIVPVVKVVLQKRQEDNQITYSITYRDETVRIYRPRLTLRATAPILFAGDVHVRLEIKDPTGNIRGRVSESEAYNEIDDTITLHVGEDVKVPVEIDGYMEGKLIVSMINADNRQLLTKLELNTDLPD